ncbi:37S ribosomal protein S16, mitochondrial [Clonorchis sinensis]|uniref:37S ribosomal protein S16, mitochondrial n=2 Tax=Clonorchis sinensis TaxID=79923 RepID=A0A8T1MSY1_CLOSI|nr:37S ribosomal protein S16, mitochondrial [Clonorchis sinensis]GAA33602.2 probable 28S ribosomal protein S16 mitochondrial [Clonorchis sinensis]
MTTAVATRCFSSRCFRSACYLFTKSRLSSDTTSSSTASESQWTPGPDKPSTWWPPVPSVPGRRIVRMYPIRHRHRPRIVLVHEGCTNRPFYTIQIKSNLSGTKDQGIEQVGSWDPFPNKDHGEHLIALNLKRISYWIAKGAEPSTKVAELLGLAGFLPVHPRTYLAAHRARVATQAFLERQRNEANMSTEETSDLDSEKPGEDPEKRPDAVWRQGKKPPWWWYNGLY